MYNKSHEKRGIFMNLNKVLKVFSIIFECSFAGAVILYIYNYYIGMKKYEVIPEALQSNLNMFMIIGIVSIILFVIIKFILYMRNKTNSLPKSTRYIEEPIRQYREETARNLEEAVTERVIIYKDAYDVPKDKRMICPNCGNIIDKNAFICIKCGYLLNRNIFKQRIETPRIEKREEKNMSNYIEKKKLINITINVGLIIAIVVCLLFIINIAMQRGILG